MSKERGHKKTSAELDPDEAFMRVAIAEAEKGVGWTSPNPAVGACIVRDGKVIGRGYHRRAGEAHAEVVAIDRAKGKVEGATLYCTLEPCVHFGRTPPCTKAIIEAGITRVVVGTLDPNPKVKGRGLRQLEGAGVDVRRNVLGEECRALNEPFNFAIVHGRPYVVLKAATSLDGRIATRNGHSQWITSPEAREEGHRMRSALDAILVGVGTVLADDPMLTARVPNGHDPVRIVLDSKLRTPVGSKLVRSAKDVPLIIATTRAAKAARKKRLEAAGAEVVALRKTRDGRVDLSAVLDLIHERELNGVLVEGGAAVHGAFVDAGMVDKVVFFVAPMLIGGEGAPASIAGRGAKRIADALVLEDLEAEPVGPDVMLTGVVRRGDR